MTEKNKYFLKAYNSLVFMKQPNIILSVCFIFKYNGMIQTTLCDILGEYLLTQRIYNICGLGPTMSM